MRIIAWNCNMALHRKFGALLDAEPDIAIISECAAPDVLAARGDLPELSGDPVWIGSNRNKGLGIFTFNGYRADLLEPYLPYLRHIAPVGISGPHPFSLLAVWAQNASAGLTRKHQLGPMRRALTKYRWLFENGPAIVAGDLNNNIFWDRPGWRINHAPAVATLDKYGLTSAYHALRGEAQGAETEPTLYWRDRTRTGPTYHIDYIFLPKAWIDGVTSLTIGDYDTWCGSGLSDHVPVIADVTPPDGGPYAITSAAHAGRETMQNLTDVDWSTLPAPEDDGAARHLTGKTLPAILLGATDGSRVDLSALTGRTIVYAYPRTGRPDQALPDGWDMIPGARGCTPQSCAFRDHAADLAALGADRLFGLSTQDTAYQREAAERLHLPFPLLSDADLALSKALDLPLFETSGMMLMKRLTLIIRDGRIEHVFYPVFPPDRSTDDVMAWLRDHPA